MTDRATRDWNTFGETEPYFAVLTHDRFLSEQMSAADREAFFAFGEADIAQIFDLIDIAPKSALDFGCGVGRLTRALVKRVHRLVQRIRGERKLPYMQMNQYDLDRVLAIMRSHGCADPRIIRTNHRGLEFAIVIAKKQM